MVKRKLLGRCQLLVLAVFVPTAPVWGQVTASPYPNGAFPNTPVQTTPVPRPPAPMVQPLPPSDPLAMNLKILAQNPYDVNALTQAGIGALEVGDPQAAIGFLARAEELSPRDGRIKAALGAALTLVERPDEALRTFGEAAGLGVSEREIAKDRGLAYDLRGDNKRAQKDYVLAEKSSNDTEIIRRHALSLGISGDKDAALKLIDPLLRKSDQSAWRARAFILALNNDMPQADRIIRAASPPSMAGSMTAFLRRLPSLTPSQRAHAVHFGTIPTSGPIYTASEPSESFRSVGNGSMDGLIGAAEPTRVASSTAVASGSPQPTRAELRRLARQEKELAKLAARGQKASGIVAAGTQTAAVSPALRPPTALPTPKLATPTVRPAQQPATTPPVQTASASQRVGARIGPVDPSRLPPELRPSEPGVIPALQPARVAVLTGATALPPPDGVRAPVTSAANPAAQSVFPPRALPSPVVAAPTLPVTAARPPAVPSPVVQQPPRLEPIPAPKPEIASAPTFLPAVPEFTAPKPPAPTPTLSAPPFGASPVAQPNVVADPKPAQVAAVDLKPTQLPPAIPPITTSPGVTTPTVATQPPAANIKPVELPPSLPSGVIAPATTSPTIVEPPKPLVAPAPLPTPNSATSTLMGPPAATDNGLPTLVEAPKPVDPVTPGFTPAITTPTESAGAPPVAKPDEPGSRLASVLDGIQTEEESAAAPLPTSAQIRAQKLAAQKKADSDAKDKLTKEADAKAAKESEAKKAAEEAAKLKANPARIWVQVATGANRSGLPITWKKLKGDAPKALADKSAWFVSFRSTHRLLAGPVKSNGDARALVTALSKEGVSANIYTSEAGQEVFRVGGK